MAQAVSPGSFRDRAIGVALILLGLGAAATWRASSGKQLSEEADSHRETHPSENDCIAWTIGR